MLRQMSSFFPFCPPLASYPLPQAVPTPLSMPTGHAYIFFGYSIAYAVLTSPWLFCYYQSVLLNSFTFFLPHPSNTPPIWQPSKHSMYLWICFCSACLFCYIFNVYMFSPIIYFHIHFWFSFKVPFFTKYSCKTYLINLFSLFTFCPVSMEPSQFHSVPPQNINLFI